MLVHINDGTVMFTFKYCFCSTHMHVSLCSFTKKCKQCDNNGEIMCYATYIFELSGFIFVKSTQQILTQQWPKQGSRFHFCAKNSNQTK